MIFVSFISFFLVLTKSLIFFLTKQIVFWLWSFSFFISLDENFSFFSNQFFFKSKNMLLFYWIMNVVNETQTLQSLTFFSCVSWHLQKRIELTQLFKRFQNLFSYALNLIFDHYIVFVYFAHDAMSIELVRFLKQRYLCLSVFFRHDSCICSNWHRAD